MGQVGQRGFHRDQAIQQIRFVVLEAEVQDVRLPAGRDVACHLEGHRRLAGALRSTDQEQLTRAQAGADRLVQWREPERHRLVLGQVTGRHPLVQVDQDVKSGARRHAAIRRFEVPGGRPVCLEFGCVCGVSHEAGALPGRT